MSEVAGRMATRKVPVSWKSRKAEKGNYWVAYPVSVLHVY